MKEGELEKELIILSHSLFLLCKGLTVQAKLAEEGCPRHFGLMSGKKETKKRKLSFKNVVGGKLSLKGTAAPVKDSKKKFASSLSTRNSVPCSTFLFLGGKRERRKS